MAATLRKMGIGGCGLAAPLSGEGEVPIRLDYSTTVPTSGDVGLRGRQNLRPEVGSLVKADKCRIIPRLPDMRVPNVYESYVEVVGVFKLGQWDS